MVSSRLEFRILGPLVVRADGRPVPVGGPKQRALLALLLLSANRVVSRERLVGELFADQSVNSADHALRNQVSRLRKALSAAAGDEPRLVARAPGYLLRVEPGELDLERFERLVTEARELLASGKPAPAAESLRAAERLWEGRPLADLSSSLSRASRWSGSKSFVWLRSRSGSMRSWHWVSSWRSSRNSRRSPLSIRSGSAFRRSYARGLPLRTAGGGP